jgi:hypothetical protein
MIGRLVAALGRRSQATRRLTFAVLALFALFVAASVLAPPPRRTARPVAPRNGTTRTQPARSASGSRPTSPAGLVDARRVTTRFLAGYLPSLYGRESARSIVGTRPGLRMQLRRMRELVTPVERQRRPRVVSLTIIGQAPAALLATALVADGGVTTYALRITLRAGPGGWLVSSVNG